MLFLIIIYTFILWVPLINQLEAWFITFIQFVKKKMTNLT